MITFSHTLKHYCLFIVFAFVSIQIYAQTPVKEGQWYTIESNQRGLVLQVQPPYQNNGIAVILAKRTRQDNQLFRFEAIGNGYYKIRSKKHNKYFDIRGASQANGGVLQVWDQANVENQKFKLSRATADNQYYITAKHSNKSIAAAASFPVGSTITQTYADGLANAMFKFIPHKSKPPKPPTPVVSTTKPVLISPVSGKVVENKKGTIIKFKWQKVQNATSYQLIVQHKNQKNTLINTAVNETYYNYFMTKPIEASLINGDWKWWIRAKIGSTWSEWSDSNKLDFTTPKRTSITLTSPSQNGMLPNGIENKNTAYTWNFDWLDVPNAEQYEILISHPSNASKSIRRNTSASYYQLTQRGHFKNNELRGWNWKVRVFKNGSYSQWTTPRTFNVAQAQKQNNPKPPVVTDNFVTQSTENFNKALKNNFAVELKNKVNNRSTSLGYNPQKNHFKMNEPFKNWHIKYVSKGIYQLQVEIDGKFWSLASEGNQRGDVKLAVDDRRDNYQLWKIIQQADGYYRIINVGNENSNSVSSDTLFYSTKNNDFFLSPWSSQKSLNARWYFDAIQRINVKQNPLESRAFKIMASNGKPICLSYVWTSDATGHNTLSLCSRDDTTLFRFERATNGRYLIKVKSSTRYDKKWYYLSGDLSILEVEQHKELPVKSEYGLQWNIISKGNGQYVLYNLDYKQAVELVHRPNRFPREVIEFRPFANKRAQYFKLL